MENLMVLLLVVYMAFSMILVWFYLVRYLQKSIFFIEAMESALHNERDGFQLSFMEKALTMVYPFRRVVYFILGFIEVICFLIWPINIWFRIGALVSFIKELQDHGK